MLSFEEAGKQPFATATLLSCAYFSPDAIPRTLLVHTVSRLSGVPLSPDSPAMDDAIGALHSFSIIIASSRFISIHRLVQAVVRERGKTRVAESLDAALSALETSFSFDEWTLSTWGSSRLLIAHIIAFSTYALDHEPTPAGGSGIDRLSGLLVRAGRYLNLQAEFATAEKVCRDALAIQERHFGTNAWQLIPTLNALGELLGAAEAYSKARESLQRAEQIGYYCIRSGLIAVDDPQHATTLNLLGEVCYHQDRKADAERFIRKALRLRESSASTHPCDLATSLNNVGKLDEIAGRFAEAEEYYGRAFRIRSKELEADHPHLATSLFNLGLMAENRRDLLLAIDLHRRGLEAREKSLGIDHPQITNSRRKLAELREKVKERDGE